MKQFKTIIVVFLLLVFFNQLYSQDSKTDSLKLVLKSEVTDTIYVKTALDIAWSYMYTIADSAVFFATKALKVAEENRFMLMVANSYNTLGVCYIVKADYYKALQYLLKGLKTANQLLKTEPVNKKFKRRLLAIYTNIGNIYYYQAKYEKAIENYITALKLSEDIDFINGIAICSSNVASAYKDLNNYPKALEYNYKALTVASKSGDRYSFTQSLNNLGSVYFSVPNYDSAYYYFYKCMKINEEDNSEYDLINSYVNLADVLREFQKYDSALYYYRLSMELSEKLKSIDGLINCNYMIGQLYLKIKKLDKSISYYKECLKLSEESGTLRFIMLANEELAEVYKMKGEYQNAYEYFVIGSIARDSIYTTESIERIDDMEAKYKTEKKEKEIVLLREETELQNAQSKTNMLVFISVIIILILVIILIIIAYRSYKLSQLAEHREMQQNSERKVLDAIIETEYKERKRFAEDLHDSLGILLSTLRLYINEIDDDTTSVERKELIDRSNCLLDDAITNARNISNNIMPAAVKNNGLEIAIRSFTDKINSSGNIKIDVQSNNFKKRYKNTLEITLYHILTEMVNNTLKHAKASQINISLTEKKDKLFITYNDNGMGFNYETIINSSEKGMGLDNTVSRVNSVGGKCTINSMPGKGFFAGIEITI